MDDEDDAPQDGELIFRAPTEADWGANCRSVCLTPTTLADEKEHPLGEGRGGLAVFAPTVSRGDCGLIGPALAKQSPDRHRA